MTATQCLFVRHGETDWNCERRCQGFTDIPLNDTGMKQAEKLGTYLQRTPIHAVYTSDLGRAVQTAEKIAHHHGLEVHKRARLRERGYGEWEGLTWEQIAARYPDREEVRQVGGKYGVELFAALQRRIIGELDALLRNHPGQTVVAVSHGGTINAFLHVMTDKRLGTGVTKIANTGVTKVTYSAETGWEIGAVNDVAHLTCLRS